MTHLVSLIVIPDFAWLLVFDNVVSLEDLDDFTPPGPGSIIITTQNFIPDLKRSIILRIEGLSIDMGSKMLKSVVSSSLLVKDEHAETISRHVDGSPLAIVQIAAYMNVSQKSSLEFLGELERQFDWADTRINDYGKKLSNVFDVVLSELGPQAQKLLDCIALLDPEGISETFFEPGPDTILFNFAFDCAESA